MYMMANAPVEIQAAAIIAASNLLVCEETIARSKSGAETAAFGLSSTPPAERIADMAAAIVLAYQKQTSQPA